MTDLVSGSDAGVSAVGSADAPAAALPPSGDDRPMAWAPVEPAPKKRRLGLWLGIGGGALLLAVAGASAILIAPGTTVAGVSVGFMTSGMAADAVSAHLATTEIELTGAGDPVTLSGADLGASVDAKALAEQAFDERRMFNLGTWMGEPIHADVSLDPEAADRALRSAMPDSYVDATDATVTFDATAKTYSATPAADGTGISLDTLTAAIDDALAAGESRVTMSGEATPVAPQISDDDAAATVEQLNGMLTKAGFYVDDERTVPIAPEVTAGWLTIAPVDGELTIEADEAKIQTVVDTLPELVNREVVNATNIVDSGGAVLKALTEGKEGRVLGDTSDLASDFAAQLGTGDAAAELPITATPFESTNLFRRIEIDLSEQRTYLYENEKLVKSYLVSTGKAGHETDKGRFRIYAQLRSQNMGREDTSVKPYYYTPNVPYISYYNGDEALHGTYWHSNFGNRMSHGCVNMPTDAARFAWEWATKGTEVWVHD